MRVLAGLRRVWPRRVCAHVAVKTDPRLQRIEYYYMAVMQESARAFICVIIIIIIMAEHACYDLYAHASDDVVTRNGLKKKNDRFRLEPGDDFRRERIPNVKSSLVFARQLQRCSL